MATNLVLPSRSAAATFREGKDISEAFRSCIAGFIISFKNSSQVHFILLRFALSICFMSTKHPGGESLSDFLFDAFSRQFALLG